MDLSNFYCVCSITNPVRYASRYKLYQHFAKHVRDAGVELYTVEAAYGDRPHAITEAGNKNHIQFRTSHELFHKENLINLAVQRLPPNWKYMAWLDADITFARPDWAIETVHQLQHFDVVQMFSHSQDLTHDYQVIPDDTVSGGEILPGMVYQEWHGNKRCTPNNPYGKHPGHCGYAWAMRRTAYETLGGLIDWSICGANDHHMARGLLDSIDGSIHGGSSPGLKNSLHIWGEKAKKLRRNLGYVSGLILHHWHGHKKGRKYRERWQILNDSQFDPYTDIHRDAQGVYQLTDDGSERMRKLRDDLRVYFRQRNEDSISMDEGTALGDLHLQAPRTLKDRP